MFPHKDNLNTKIKFKYKSQEKFFKKFFKRDYEPWQKNNLSIKGIQKSDISKKIALLEFYYKKIEDANNYELPGLKKGWITFQSKFRSSVLEEFSYYLLKDLPEIKKLNLEFRRRKVHAGFEINSNGNILTREKDVDCCIVRATNGIIDNKKISLLIPIIAVECKTYLDSTMWNEAQYSALLLKRVNSSAKVYVLTEDNQVKLNKITKESPIDDIFVIRDKSSLKVDTNVIFAFLNQIRKDLKRIINPNVIKIPGRLINF